jgi:nucleoside-diphosphate-sugar epimerase
MRILLTGASSFTGMWYAEALVAAGHDVVATLYRHRGDYAADPLRELRVRRLEALAPRLRLVEAVTFGSERFQALFAGDERFDVLCHHAADVRDYKSPDFDPVKALADNAFGLVETLRVMRGAGCDRLVLTGSVFEQREGAGTQPAGAFSPYGLSKGLTADLYAFYAAREGVTLGKVVIPNPFGAFEEPRFTAYLMKSWAEGRCPTVGTPAYIRDNIQVSLLAAAYAGFVAAMPSDGGFHVCRPSGYVESQGDFARRFAREMAARLMLDCPLELAHQTVFAEPPIRINTDRVDADRLGWNEAAAWDGVARFYADRLNLPLREAAGDPSAGEGA